jgi:hypothetical protein
MLLNVTVHQSLLIVTLFVVNYFLIPTVLHADALSAAKKVNPIQIEITTHLGNDQTFVEGDHISFLLNLDSDAYLLAIYQDVAGNLIQLLPNRESPKGPHKAGLFIRLPRQNAKYRFKVAPPYGKETLWIFASNVLPLTLKGKNLANGLKVLDGEIVSLRNKLRRRNQAAYGEARLTISTRARENVNKE